MHTPFRKNSRQRRRSHNTRSQQVSIESLEARSLLTTLVWSNAPALPAPQTDAVAVLGGDNAIHLVGGSSATPTAAPQLAANGNGWVPGKSIDTQRNDLGAIRSGNSIFLFGGTGNNEGINEVLSYDYRNGDSQDLAKMNRVRYDHGFAADASGRAYAIGGIGVYADGEIWSEAERYDPATDAWTPIAPLPQALHGMSAIGDGNGHIFVFGGSTTLDDSGIQNTSYRYDIAADTWTQMGPMPTGTSDSAVTMDEHGTIYVLGGRTTAGVTDAVQAYDPTTNAWTSNTPLPAPIYGHAAAYDSLSRVIVVGGFDATGTPTAAVHRSQRLNVDNSPPVIKTTPVLNGSLDKAYTYDVDATGNPAPTYSLVTAPAGMTIDRGTGLISWQPAAGQLGVNPVTVRASNVVADVDQSFDITVVADTIAPTAPADLAVTDATETTITLGWTASQDAVGVDRYEVSTAVYSGPRFGKRWRYTVVDTVPGDTTTSTISGLAPLSITRFSVQAIDAAGNRSARSARVAGTTLAAPTLSFRFGNQTSGTIQSPAKTPIEIQLQSRANPAPVFSIDSGPAGMVVDPDTGLVRWTPAVADIGLQDVIFRATNSVGSADLTVSIDVVPDAPQLSVTYNPATGGQRFALAGTLFTAQVNDASSSASTYELIDFPVGMEIDSVTGLISWTPTGAQGGKNSVTVRGTNSGGTTDLTFPVDALFTGAVTNVAVTGTSLAEPTASWTAPTGEGSDLVSSYAIAGFAQWGVGRTRKTHRVNYTVPASETSVLMTGLVTGKAYTLTITALDAAGNPGLASTGTSFVSNPALPSLRWTVPESLGSQVANPVVVAAQPMRIILSDQRPDPSNVSLVSGPAGLTFNPDTKVATWTPSPADVTPDYAGRHHAVFEATNSVGSVTISVPLFVSFSGSVRNLTAIKYGTVALAEWDAPTDNVNPVESYKVTRHWTWSGRKRSSSWTISGNATSVVVPLSPTGAVVHKGVTITPIDASGNLGVGAYVAYGERANNYAPIAVDDAYDAVEDTTLVVDAQTGVRVNDIDTDNTPFFNPLQARLVTAPANGTVSLTATGALTYVPRANFNGVDTFTYLVNDGKFNSNIATVTINVAAINDAPAALDDAYSVDQDTRLSADAAVGVQANDSDIDGDVLATSLVTGPSNGTVTLNADGSFVYTPNAGFTGKDSFTYVASDSLLESRTATAAITVNATTPPAKGTRFYVVDYSNRSTFEYQTDGKLVETYGLPKENKKPLGVAANLDGSLVWTVDKQKRVFIYDDAGKKLGMWVPKGLSKPDGIATDGTDIWIVDRSADTVYFFAGGANRRNGNASPTSQFALHRANRQPKGITTDGTSIWVVNDTGKTDSVFKYDTAGALLGRWTIDAANTKPAGITIDPNHVDDVWIVDSAADRVFEYLAGATRTSGTKAADRTFDLDAANVNAQGIADPRPAPAVASADPLPAAAEPPATGGSRVVATETDLFEPGDRVARGQVPASDSAPADPQAPGLSRMHAQPASELAAGVSTGRSGPASEGPSDGGLVDLLFGDVDELSVLLSGPLSGGRQVR